MRSKFFITLAAAIAIHWRAQCYPVTAPTSGSLIQQGAQLTADQQRAVNQANYVYEARQIVTSARNAANQASAYASQAEDFKNESAKQAARYAIQAAEYANQAAAMAASTNCSLAAIEQVAVQATQAAAGAKQSAEQAKMDSAVAILENERDKKLAAIKAKYADIPALESKLSDLKDAEQQLYAWRAQEAAARARLLVMQSFEPRNPWRMLNGKIVNVHDLSWVQFIGHVQEISANGIVVHGSFGPPMEVGAEQRDFFVDNFPLQTYPLADGDMVTVDMKLMAHLGDITSAYRFTSTTDRRVHTVRKLDYGKVIDSPPPELVKKADAVSVGEDNTATFLKKLNANQQEQQAVQAKLQQLNDELEQESAPIIAAYDVEIENVPNLFAQHARAVEAAKKQAVVDKVLKNNEELADKGDVYGLLRMGERYRDGDGVPKDLIKAKTYLQQAATSGSLTAANELKALSNNPNF